LEQRLFEALDRLVLIDPHTHINPLSPSSQTIADLLGYHYYTELAHSAGLARERIEQPGIDPKEKVARLFEGLGPIENTVQWSWMLELCQRLLDFPADRIDRSNWESLYDLAASRMSQPGWEEEVLRRSGLEAVFLTNDFDDPLEGFSTRRYVPCLRTDDLVFHLAKPQVRGRLAKATGIDPGGIGEVSDGIGRLFEHFVGKGARACAISLPPDFAPVAVSHASAASAWTG
jgi:glucuronate isomerase